MNKEGIKGYRMSDGGGAGAGGRHRDLNVHASSSSSYSYLFDASNCSIRRRAVFFVDDNNDNDDHNNTVMMVTPQKKIDGMQDSKMMMKKKTPAKKTNTTVDSIFRGRLSSPMNVLKTATTTLPVKNSPNTAEASDTTITTTSNNSSSFTILLHHKWKSFWIEQRRFNITKQYMHQHKKARGEVWRYHFTKIPAIPIMKRQKHENEQERKSYPLLLSPQIQDHCRHHDPSSSSHPLRPLPPKIPRMIQIQKMNNGFIKPTMKISSSSTTHATMKKPYNGSSTSNGMIDGRIVSGKVMNNPTMKEQKRRINVTIDTDVDQLYDDTGMIVLALSKEWPPQPSTTTSSSSSAVRKPYHSYRPQQYKKQITITSMNGSNSNKMKVMKMNNNNNNNNNKEPAIQGIVYQRMTLLPSFDSNIKEILCRNRLKNTFASSLLHTGYVLQILSVTDDFNNNNDDVDDNSCFELKKLQQRAKKINKKTKKMSEPVLI